MIYLDNAATTLIKPLSVQQSMIRAMTTAASPGRGGHSPAINAAEIIFKCREAAATLFNVNNPEQVVFTFNATHALNIAINSLATKNSKVLVSGYEHNSVTRPLEALGCEIIVAGSRLFDADSCLKAIEEKIALADLVACTHVSNVFGFILPVYEIAALCKKHKVPLIVDASQSAGILDVDFQKLDAAFIAMPGHKSLFGPQGTGILLCKDLGKVFISGGTGSDSIHQQMPVFLPDRHEAGTHNVPGVAGLCAGINYVLTKGRDEIMAHEQKLVKNIYENLSGQKDFELFYGGESSQIGVISMRSKKYDCEEIGQMLAAEGVCVRSGLHCAPYAHRSAATLETGTVRASVSPFVTLENTEEFCRILEKLLN